MARVKQTGKANYSNVRRDKPNGTTGAKRTPQHPSTTSGANTSSGGGGSTTHTTTTKTPTTQPTELSESDKVKLKSWLDHQARPFSTTTAPLSRKRKRGPSVGSAGGGGAANGGGAAASGGMMVQADLFEDRLSVQYEVRPADKWDCLRRYKKFTVGQESIGVGAIILVKHDELDESQMDVAAQWKAKVLEVRALDSEHVYIRVAWLNRPEDLGGGRQPHHGRYELIPTNFMDVIDAMTVNGSLEVHHWDEKDDDSPVIDVDEFFWRQSFDFVNTNSFSKLRTICVDNAPQNPDELILQCANTSCKKWMHVKCIAEDAAQRAAESATNSNSSNLSGDSITINTKNGISSTPKSANSTPKNSRKKSSTNNSSRPEIVRIEPDSQAQAKAKAGAFTAEVLIKDLPYSTFLSIPDDVAATAAGAAAAITTGGGSNKQQQDDVKAEQENESSAAAATAAAMTPDSLSAAANAAARAAAKATAGTTAKIKDVVGRVKSGVAAGFSAAGVAPAKVTEIVIRDLKTGEIVRREDVVCLFCGTRID